MAPMPAKFPSWAAGRLGHLTAGGSILLNLGAMEPEGMFQFDPNAHEEDTDTEGYYAGEDEA